MIPGRQYTNLSLVVVYPKNFLGGVTVTMNPGSDMSVSYGSGGAPAGYEHNNQLSFLDNEAQEMSDGHNSSDDDDEDSLEGSEMMD